MKDQHPRLPTIQSELPLEVEPITEYFKREPLAQGSYPSKVFEVSNAVNPLLRACAPLLTLATQLFQQTKQPPLEHLHILLSHEIKAFEVKARQLHYQSPIILAARYLLCAFLDDIILQKEWGKNSSWVEQNLLKTFQHETRGSDKFFVILERCLEDPKLYLDLLELGYICLNLGYEGRYQNKPNGRYELSHFIDRLYDCITDERAEKIEPLYIKNVEKKRTFHLSYKFFIPIIAFITLITIVFIYIPHAHQVNSNAKVVGMTLDSVLTEPQVPNP